MVNAMLEVGSRFSEILQCVEIYNGHVRTAWTRLRSSWPRSWLRPRSH